MTYKALPRRRLLAGAAFACLSIAGTAVRADCPATGDNVACSGGGTNIYDTGTSPGFFTLAGDPAGTNILNLSGRMFTLGEITDFDTINVNGTAGSSIWVVAHPVEVSGAINLNSGFLGVNNASSLGTPSIVDNAGPADMGGLWFNNATSGTFSGSISGTGVVYVGWNPNGAAVTTLDGANTYSGGTYVDVSTLRVAGGSALADDGDVQLSKGGTLDVATTETIGTLNDGLLYGGTGSVMLSGGDLVVHGGAFSGAISGAHGLVKIGTGTLVLSGENDYTGNTSVADGVLAANLAIAAHSTLEVSAPATLSGEVATASGSTVVVDGRLSGTLANDGTLSGTGVIAGQLVNTGTVTPGHGNGVLTVEGGFAQSSAGRLLIQVSPDVAAGAGYDQLLITGPSGTAALGGTLEIEASTAAQPYVDGATYDFIRASGGIAGDFDTVSGATLSPFIGFAPAKVQSGADAIYRLTVVRTLYADGIGAAATANQRSTADGFQALVAGASGPVASIVSQVDALDAKGARRFFDQASPEAYGAYARALLDDSRTFSGRMGLRLLAPRDERGVSVWGRGFETWGRGRGGAQRFSSDVDTGGGAGGIDLARAGFVAGAAAGWSRDRVAYSPGTSRGTLSSWQAGAFAGYRTGPFSVDLKAAYSGARVRASRAIDLPASALEARGSTRGRSWDFAATAGFDIGAGPFDVRPFVGIGRSDARLDGFVETAAGPLGLTVGTIRAARLDAILGVDLGSTKAGSVAPYARAEYRRRLAGRDPSISAFFEADPSSRFTIATLGSGDSELRLDAGLGWRISPRLSLSAGYEGAFRRDLKSHGLTAGLRFAFGG